MLGLFVASRFLINNPYEQRISVTGTNNLRKYITYIVSYLQLEQSWTDGEYDCLYKSTGIEKKPWLRRGDLTLVPLIL